VLEEPRNSSILNCLPARILSATKLENHEMLIALGLGEKGDGAHILSRISTHSWRMLHLYEGMQLYAQIKGVSLLQRS